MKMQYRKIFHYIVKLELIGYILLFISIVLYPYIPSVYTITIIFLIVNIIIERIYPCGNFYDKTNSVEKLLVRCINSFPIIIMAGYGIIFLLVKETIDSFVNVSIAMIVFISVMYIFLLRIYALKKILNNGNKHEFLHFIYRQRLKQLNKHTLYICLLIVFSLILAYFRK